MIRPTPLAALALVSTAGAQSPFTTGSTVTYSLGFVEIGGNTNGTLEPGESALIQISVSFSNQNTTATYTPPTNPPPGSGTIRGFGYGFIDFVGSSNNGGNANGAWNTDFVNPNLGPIADGWDPLGPPGWGTPASGGSELRNIQFGQVPLNTQSILIQNPINLMWQGLWTPSSYAARTVTFEMVASASSGGLASSVIFKTGIISASQIKCPSNLASTQIALVPAPNASVVAMLLVLNRRKRRTECRP